MVEIHQEMSELLDKQVNAQKEENIQGSRKLQISCIIIITFNKHTPKSNYNSIHVLTTQSLECSQISGYHVTATKPFITSIQNTGENSLHELRGNNEGNNCLLNG